VDAYYAAGLAAVVEKPINPVKLSQAVSGHAVGGWRSSGLRADIPQLFDRQQIGLILDSFVVGRSIELLAELDASIQDSLRSIRRSLADGQLADVSRRAHRLAGAALNFGLPALHKSAQELELSIERGGTALLGQLVLETEQAADAALQAIALLRRSLSNDVKACVADGQITASS